MKRFRFTLESVRTLREHKLREAQLHYAGALRACEEVSRRLQQLDQELEGCWELLRQELASHTPAQALARTSAYGRLLEERRKGVQAQWQAAQQRAAQAAQGLALATRDCEALVHYRAKLFRVHTLGLHKEEQKLLDDIGVRLLLQARASNSSTSNPVTCA
jgi:flagellar export protein FliJ